MNSLEDLYRGFQKSYNAVQNEISEDKNILIQEFNNNVEWLSTQIQEERLSRNFLDDELSLKISKRDKEDWYDLPKGTDVFFAVPYEEMHILTKEVRFVFQAFIDLVEKRRFLPSRIVYLLQQVIEETNKKLKPLKLILSR